MTDEQEIDLLIRGAALDRKEPADRALWGAVHKCFVLSGAKMSPDRRCTQCWMSDLDMAARHERIPWSAWEQTNR